MSDKAQTTFLQHFSFTTFFEKTVLAPFYDFKQSGNSLNPQADIAEPPEAFSASSPRTASLWKVPVLYKTDYLYVTTHLLVLTVS